MAAAAAATPTSAAAAAATTKRARIGRAPLLQLSRCWAGRTFRVHCTIFLLQYSRGYALAATLPPPKKHGAPTCTPKCIKQAPRCPNTENASGASGRTTNAHPPRLAATQFHQISHDDWNNRWIHELGALGVHVIMEGADRAGINRLGGRHICWSMLLLPLLLLLLLLLYVGVPVDAAAAAGTVVVAVL